MKIHFDNVARNGTGPGTFASRLAQEFQTSGHQVLTNATDADVSLVFIERSGAPLAARVVQRLDGIWFKPDEFLTKNIGIKDLFCKADAVICQSHFDRAMVERWWTVPRGNAENVTVINNGIEIKPITELTIPALIQMRSEYRKMYVCSSNWHPQKRLWANVELFERLRAREPSSCLIIMGNNPDVRVSGPHVFYTGPVGPDVYNQIYSAANWMLHLAWADHCPNVVVEALAQGTPVVCSGVGGTKELVGSYGLIIKEDEYDFGLVDYDKPPSIDVSQVDDLPDRQSLNYDSIADINIQNVARRYVKVFDALVKGYRIST